MIYVYYFFGAVLIFFSYRSLVDGFAYLRYFRMELSKPPSNFSPFITVFAPCRGVDDGMDANLSALIEQNLPAHEVIFVVDSEDDTAVAVIQRIRDRAAATGIQTNLVIAPKASRSSQKVENLREAVLHADRRSEVFVFVDSDTRPLKTWLRELVAPLADENIGAATGYRWFISKKPTFASELRSVWNASIASALGPNTHSNFCWGGSMAIRRDIFERIGMREKWSGTLSDDFAITRAMHEADLPIVFVPQALTASVENCTFREMLEFTTRQMKITRVYGTKLWILSFFGSAMFVITMTASIAIAVLWPVAGIFKWAAIAIFFFVSICSTGKAWLRLRAVELVLRDHATALARQHWTQNTLWILSPVVFLYNAIAALVSRQMVWRGTRYELISPNETVIIGEN